MQCARRWMDDGEVQQVLNGGKYLSALIAAVVRVAYVQSETGGWLIVYVACSLVSSLFGVYWDTVRDWGLLQAKSANPWLRDHLLLKHRGVYYISMVRFSTLLFLHAYAHLNSDIVRGFLCYLVCQCPD